MKRYLGWMRVALLDLRGDLRRFGVLIACLALGTAAIAAVGSVGGGLKSAVVRDATVLMGGDLEAFRADRDATAEELAFLETFGKVAHAVDTNVRAVAGDNSVFADIAAVGDNYPLVGNVGSPQLADGQKPGPLLGLVDGAWGALIDPGLFQQLGIDIGDTFTVSDTVFEVRGALGSLPDGAVRGFHLGLTMLISDAALATLSDLREPLPGLLTHHRYKVLLEGHSYEVAATSIESRFNDPDWTIRSPRDAAGNLARYYDLFARFLLIVGLSSLLVGGVGVSTGVTAYLGERLKAIATMRSLGMTSGRLMVHFLTQIGVLTAIGVGIGIVAGALSSIIALPFIGRALAVNLPASIDIQALLTAAAFGFLAGFAFSFIPLARAQRVSPALLFRTLGATIPSSRLIPAVDAGLVLPVLLAAVGIFLLAWSSTGDIGLVGAYALGAIFTFLLLRAAAWLLQRVLRSLPPIRNKGLRYALRNIHRPGSTAPAVIMSLGLGLAIVLVIALLNSNLSTQLLGVISKDAPTFVATELFDDEVQAIADIGKTDPAMVKFDYSPSVRAHITKVAGADPKPLREIDDEVSFLLGSDIPVTWRTTEPADGSVVDGKWWPGDYTGEPLISLRSSLKKKLGLKVGDTIEFDVFGDLIEAKIANFRDYEWQNGLNFVVTFSPGAIEFYPYTFLGTIKAAEGKEKALERKLAETFPEVSFIPIGDALKQAASILGQLATGVSIVGGLAVVNGLLVLAGTMAAGRKQRESDAVVHKVLGATRRSVLWVFTLEYGMLGAFAAFVATIVGIAAAWAITVNALEVGFSADPLLIAIVVAGAVAMTIGAGAVTTWQSLSTRPARYLRSI